MQKRTRWIGGALIVALSVLAAGVSWFLFVTMNGGIYSIILNMRSRPDLDSPDLQRARTRLEEQIDAEFSRAMEKTGFARYQISKQDSCYDGVNNWKHQDGFAHRCTLRVTNFYGFDGDFRNAMLDFEKALLAAGWHSNIHDMAWSLTNNSAVAQDRPTGRPANQYPDSINPYYKGGFALDIGWAQRGETRLFHLENTQAHNIGWINENNFYDQRKLADVGNVFREVTRDHTYIAAIAISGHYFEN
jgi:hypothetical protein